MFLQEREAAYEKEQKLIQIEKEKEVARLRALQERAKDEQAERDAVRARRAQAMSLMFTLDTNRNVTWPKNNASVNWNCNCNENILLTVNNSRLQNIATRKV